ncbi:malignant fibrous histiocytoma-amplified sequence 1 homolog [Ylistrum balloti]|uniref:malignant fibrous histiocytoma-amplified sequence 1 homolog n=1 Tax=Ylistrum balloti TaxID=509963 RepID=UPI0029058550|nr:malignant fibrous histiocytoma-amplified sequence 1 homolog [Ylistrum balloti]
MVDIMATSQGQSQVSEALKQYVQRDLKDKQILVVPEGKYKGWVPRSIYSLDLDEVYLPFLRLQSFPVGGTSLGTLTKMKVFEAVGNYLFKLPSAFGNCKDLKTLNLSFNYFNRLSPSVFKLENLTELDVSNNELTELSSDVGQMKNLKALNLSGNMLSGVPDELSKCKALENVNLSRKWYPRDGGMTELPSAACSLPELRQLDVSWHQIHTIPDNVGSLTKLQYLNLKGNFLKNVSENITQCVRLQVLDLSGAMKLNSVIPEQILMLSELKVLNLSGNYFTELPKEVAGLKKLEKFVMRRNALLRLPDSIFDLEFLETLELSDNYLYEIPPAVQNLKNIRYIDLQGNKLTGLPDELGRCFSLVHLSLACNELTSVPDSICRLLKLQELSLDHNQLKELPMLLDKLALLEKSGRLSVYDNYLSKPPQEICNQGVVSLFRFLKEMRISEAKHRRKMILIGAAKAGKTSLRNALMLGHSKLAAEHERTWVLERHLWEPEPSLRVQILDFGGHHIYSAAHHMFLTPEALHLVVFDLAKYEEDKYDTMVGDWIDAIADRAPGAHIMVVGTHADLCANEEVKSRINHIIQKMSADEKAKIDDLKLSLEKAKTELMNLTGKESNTKFEDIDAQRKRDKVSGLQRVLNMRVTLASRVEVVSCADTLDGVDNLRALLQQKLKETDEKPLPKSWYKYLLGIQKKKQKILHWQQALSIFKDIMDTMNQSMISLEGSAESSLDMVLRYLHSTGEIVWYHDNPRLRSIIFHRPETLVEMLRAIFRHDFEKVVQFNDTYGRLANLSLHKFEEMKVDFLEQGLMTVELLHYCLLHFQLTTDARDMFIDLMLKFDLCYEVPKLAGAPMTFASSRILRFPWFLKSEVPTNFTTQWPLAIPSDIIQLCYRLQFKKRLPPNLFEKFSARLQTHIMTRHDWKNGVLAKRNRTKLLVTREAVDVSSGGRVDVSVSVRGSDLQELWLVMLGTYGDMITLLQEWPFTRYEQWLLCSHCLIMGDDEPFLYPGEVLQTLCPRGHYQLTSCRKAKDVPIPACFLFPLDPEYQEDIAEHIKVVKEFLLSTYDTVDGGGNYIQRLLSNLGLSYIAARCGAEWSLMALALGLTQPEIEQIQLDNPYQTVKQITTALVRWRDRRHNTTEDAVLSDLLTALQTAGRQDLVDDLEEKFHIQVNI